MMSIDSANREWSLARSTARSAQDQDDDRRRQLREIEDLLDDVEVCNLRDQLAVPPSVFEEIARLAPRIAVPAPAAVWKARNAERLHQALLAWQGKLLDALRGHRLNYVDRFD